jgi:hypothetical protein
VVRFHGGKEVEKMRLRGGWSERRDKEKRERWKRYKIRKTQKQS